MFTFSEGETKQNEQSGWNANATIPELQPTTFLSLSGTPGKANYKTLKTQTKSPTPRWGHTSTIVGPDQMIMFGGYGDEKFTDHIFSYEPATTEWKRITPKNKSDGPSPRSNHSATAVGRNLLIVHGGGKRGKFDTFHAYDAENERWCAVNVSHVTPLPPQRSGHAACRIGNKYVACFGGKISKEDTSDTFLIDVQDMLPDRCPSGSPPMRRAFECPIWDGKLPSIMSIKPKARRFHSLCTHWRTGKGIMFGGCYGEYECLGDVWILSLKSSPTPPLTNGLSLNDAPTIEWECLTPQGKGPTRRWGHAASMVGDHMVIIGGRAQSDLMDIHILTLSSLSDNTLVSKTSNRWSTPDLSVSPTPHPRRRATACTYAGNAATITRGVDGTNQTRILIFGGYDGKFRNDLLQLKVDGFQYTPATPLPIASEVVMVDDDGADFLGFPGVTGVIEQEGMNDPLFMEEYAMEEGGNTATRASAHPLAPAARVSSIAPFQKLSLGLNKHRLSKPPSFPPPKCPPPKPPVKSTSFAAFAPSTSSTSSAPSAPSAPSNGGWGGMFVPPPDTSTSNPLDLFNFGDPSPALIESSNELVFGETKSNATTANKEMKIKCSDNTISLLMQDVEILRRHMPAFFIMTSDEVKNALPRLRQYDQTQKKEDTKHRHPLGLQAVRFHWMDQEDVQSVIQMGYSRARTIRAISKSKTDASELTLNILLDICEKEKEHSKEDEMIEATYIHAMETSSKSSRSNRNKPKGLYNSLRSKSKDGSGRKQRQRVGGRASSSSSSQRVVELETQLNEMKEDLTTLLQCSISFELMKDPVVTPNGQLYDRSKIEQWIKAKHTDPSTRQSLRRSQLISVRGLKDIADKYRGRGLLECDE